MIATLKEFWTLMTTEMLQVPVWEVLLLLLISTICQLLRAARTGIFIIYIFTLHLAWNFLRLHLPIYGLIAFAVIAGTLLVAGLISTIFGDN